MSSLISRRRCIASLPALLSVPGIAFANARASRIADALDDMKRQHEVIPLGVAKNIGWKRRPELGANTEPYGNSIPSYWRGKRFAEWRAMLPWFVIYEGEPRNPAVNVQVEVSGIECWVLLQSTRRWILAGSSLRPVWDSIYAPNAVDRIADHGSGQLQQHGIRYTPRSGTMVHGGLGQLPIPWYDGAADIRAVYASARHRLTVKDESLPDDRDVANLGLQVGVDYYPWVGARLKDLDAAYVPAAGLGRFLAVAPEWRYSSVILRKSGVTEDELLTTEHPEMKY